MWLLRAGEERSRDGGGAAAAVGRLELAVHHRQNHAHAVEADEESEKQMACDH